MILDTVNKSIQAFLGGGITAVPLSFNSQASSQQTNSTSQPLQIGNAGILQGVTPVTIIAHPTSSNTQVTPVNLNIFNGDSADAVVFLVLNNNGTFFTWYEATLHPGDNLIYTSSVGFYVVSSDGSFRGISPLPLGAASESTLVDLQTLFALSSQDQTDVLRAVLKQLIALSEARGVASQVDPNLVR